MPIDPFSAALLALQGLSTANQLGQSGPVTPNAPAPAGGAVAPGSGLGPVPNPSAFTPPEVIAGMQKMAAGGPLQLPGIFEAAESAAAATPESTQPGTDRGEKKPLSLEEVLTNSPQAILAILQLLGGGEGGDGREVSAPVSGQTVQSPGFQLPPGITMGDLLAALPRF